ncbi:MAG: pyruvate formate-lyase-activating protein [Saccharofermentanales bacterium]|jgi:pyruvate formate lyase activating enzyme|nr:pyruvate formate-lyase-activating protein [Bacillota bacterium]NLB09018.1 pyruvate formate lyase-activating protein [Clostridiales bacterium]
MTGNIHSIETMGLMDGPGVRTVFFLQGCPLRCAYCHNPDTLPLTSDTAQVMTPEEILAVAKRQKNYFGQEGGITFTGGEPLQQSPFLVQCLRLLKQEDIHTAVDTSGIGPSRYWPEILKLTDTLLLDVKAFDAEGFQDLTGGSFETFLRFTTAIRSHQFSGNIWVRHVMVPGYTDNEADMERLAELILPLGFLIDRIEILPYHTMGREKYRQLGLSYRLDEVPPMDQARAKEFERLANRLFIQKLPHAPHANAHVLYRAAALAAQTEVTPANPDKEVTAAMSSEAPLSFRADSIDTSVYLREGIDLRQLPLLRHLSVSQFHELANSVEVRRVKKGEYIFRSGDPCSVLYIVCEGQFKILTYTPDGREQIMYIYSPGDFVGGFNLLKSQKYLYFGQALEDGIICTMSKEFFDKACLQNPNILRQILEKAYDRLRWAEELITRLSSSNASMKVAELLTQLADRRGVETPDGIRIDLTLTREEMGSFAGMTRETITRKLGEFKDLGYIDYTSNRTIYIQDKQALKDYFLGC